ncbi:MAG: hypothetical protein U1U88_001613, partial [Lawsonella clevelandensis]
FSSGENAFAWFSTLGQYRHLQPGWSAQRSPPGQYLAKRGADAIIAQPGRLQPQPVAEHISRGGVSE